MNRTSLIAAGLIAAFALLLLLPAFIYGSGGFDLRLQALWVKLFTQQFWQGELYPRWLIDMNAGHGTPTFFYYPPTAYFITALLWPLTTPDTAYYNAMAISMLLAAAVGGIGFYIWMKEETGNGTAALIGSLLYMGAPHNVAWNFYYWLLFSSVWAYAWVPFLMYFARRAALGHPYAIAGFAIALCLLVMTNLPMTVIWGPVVVLYGLIHFRKASLTGQAVRLGSATILGFCLSAIFLLPALLYMHDVNVDLHWDTESADYNHYFLIFGFNRLGQTVLTITWIFMALLTLLYSWRAQPRPRTFLFFPVVSLAALFMVLPLSKPLWDHIFLLRLLQFPERAFTVPSLVLAVLASMCWPRFKILSCVLIPLYVYIAFTLGSWDTRVTPEQWKTLRPQEYKMFSLNIEHEHYLTSRSIVNRYHTPEGIAEVEKHMEQVERVSGDADVEVRQWKPRDIVLHYRADQGSTLRVRQFYFPGWQAIAGNLVLTLRRDPIGGEILIDVPPGMGEIHLQLPSLTAELAGREVSIVAAAILLILTLLQLRKRHGA